VAVAVVKRTLIFCAGFGCIMAALQAQNYVVVLAGIAAAAFLTLRARVTTASGYATIRGHTHDGPIRQVAIHEGGHAAAARRVGGRVLDARVSGNDRRASGYTEVVIPNDPASQIGVYLAGFAAAPGTSSPNDQYLVDQVLSTVPSPLRGYVLREGQKIANSVAGSSDVMYYAKRLEERWRL
jgi:hypothetical protein